MSANILSMSSPDVIEALNIATRGEDGTHGTWTVDDYDDAGRGTSWHETIEGTRAAARRTAIEFAITHMEATDIDVLADGSVRIEYLTIAIDDDGEEVVVKRVTYLSFVDYSAAA